MGQRAKDLSEKIEAFRDDVVTYVESLNDDELDRQGSMPAFGGEVTVNQVLEFVIFQSAQDHFDSIKKAVGR